MLGNDRIHELASRARGIIGIGVKLRDEVIKNSVRRAEDSGLPNIEIYDDAARMCIDLRDRRICAAVRGTLSSHEIIESMREVYGVDKILRIALLATAEGKPFFLAPVGIDEGNTLDERFELLRQGIRYLRCLGVDPAVSVLSKGRAEDAGRGDEIRRSIEEGEQLVHMALKQGLKAQHRHILIEQAVADSDFVLAPDGVSGNLIFRSLYFLGQGSAVGAPVVNIGRVFVDTSRDKRSYVDSLALAAALCAARESHG